MAKGAGIGVLSPVMPLLCVAWAVGLMLCSSSRWPHSRMQVVDPGNDMRSTRGSFVCRSFEQKSDFLTFPDSTQQSRTRNAHRIPGDCAMLSIMWKETGEDGGRRWDTEVDGGCETWEGIS